MDASSQVEEVMLTDTFDFVAEHGEMGSFQTEWARFQRVNKNRKAHFESENQQKFKSTSRLFIIARKEDPWDIFGLESRRDYCNRVYGLSALHFTELHEASADGDKTRVERLLRSAATRCKTLARDSSGRIPLHQAVVREHHGVIRLLMKQADGRLQLHVRDTRDATPVQYVLEKMHCVALKVFPGHSPARKTQVLVSASKRYRRLWKLADRMLRLVEPLLRQRLRSMDERVRGDAWDAVKLGNLARLKTLFELYPELTNEYVSGECLGQLGWTLLHEACMNDQQNLNVLYMLVTRQQLNRFHKDQSGSTPLHHAAMRGWLEGCVLLLDEQLSEDAVGTDELLMATDTRGRTPLHVCLHFAGRRRHIYHEGDTDVLMTARFLVKQCPMALHITDLDGFSPLHYAVCFGDRALVDLMIALGANVFCGVQETSRKCDYGAKAQWAPCGSRFHHTSGNHKHHQRPVSLRNQSTVDKLLHAVMETPRRLAVSKACERMRMVKAGQIEHPGVTLPMETFWFLLRGNQPTTEERSASTADLVSTDPSMVCSESKHAGQAHESAQVETIVDQSDELDPRRSGCRRYGAVCAKCPQVDPSLCHDLSKPSSAIPGLVLAIRCCHQAHTLAKQSSSRFEIVQSLLLAGCVVDMSAIEEAMLSFEHPQLIPLVLAHSGSSLSSELLLKHFCSRTNATDDGPLRSAMLLWLAKESPDLFAAPLLAMLFRHQYFGVIEHILSAKLTAGDDFVRTLDEVFDVLTHPRRWKNPVQHRELEAVHLNRLQRWTSMWPVGKASIVKICVASIDEVLKARSGYQFTLRQTTDNSIIATIVVITTSHTELDGFVIPWLTRALDKALVETVGVLWRIALSKCELVTRLAIELSWPLRLGERTTDNTTKALGQALIRSVLDHQNQGDELRDEVLTTCLALVCIYTLPSDLTTKLAVFLKKSHPEPLKYFDILAFKRFGSLTSLQWMVRNDSVEAAELMITKFESDPRQIEQLWCELVLAVLASCSADCQQWRVLLFTKFKMNYISGATQLNFLRRLPRVRASSKLLSDVIRFLLESNKSADEVGHNWIQATPLVHNVARWNSIDLMEELLSQVKLDALSWSHWVTRCNDGDACSPIELCDMLGHAKLARIMRRLVVSETDSLEAPKPRHFGVFRTMMELPPTTTTCEDRKIRSNGNPSDLFQGDWAVAVAMDDICALEALALHAIPLAIPTSSATEASVARLRTAIRHGSLNALRWLLDNSTSAMNTDLLRVHGTDLVLQAARHTSKPYAELTLFLLQRPDLSLGRLSGDGDAATLLHRAACFTDATLACSIIELLLQRGGSDVNVRDGVGFTPVAYAIAAGNISTVCFLLQRCNARLENEFEGQSAFYYTLQLLPSFFWRWIVENVLRSARRSAFLHCTSDDCACKSFERAEAIDANSTNRLEPEDCSFCGHTVEFHSRVPYPPWFRDQYETYLAPGPALEGSSSDCDDFDGDEDEDAAALRRQRTLLAAPVEDEAALERDRGRLVPSDLARIAAFRFRDILLAHSLSLPHVHANGDSENIEHREEERMPTPSFPRVNAEETNTLVTYSNANLEDAELTLAPQSAPVLTPSSNILVGADEIVQQHIQRPRDGAPAIELALLPWFLRGDAAMAFRSDGHFNLMWNRTPEELVHMIVVTWLLLSARNVLRERGDASAQAISSTTQLFARWRDVTRPATSTTTSNNLGIHGGGLRECTRVASATRVAFDLPVNFVPRSQEEERAEEGEIRTQIAPMSLASLSSAYPIGPARAHNCVSILQLFVHHWRFARVYQCFRQWKRSSVNTQVTHNELETLGAAWAADARRERFLLLRAKQQELENNPPRTGIK